MSPGQKQRSGPRTPGERRRWAIPLAPAALALALLVVAGLVLIGLQWRSQPQKEGQLAFTPESIDLGRVPIGQTAAFRFALRNIGDKPVKITSKPKVAALEGC